MTAASLKSAARGTSRINLTQLSSIAKSTYRASAILNFIQAYIEQVWGLPKLIQFSRDEVLLNTSDSDRDAHVIFMSIQRISDSIPTTATNVDNRNNKNYHLKAEIQSSVVGKVSRVHA